jgi:phage gpG-like protein
MAEKSLVWKGRGITARMRAAQIAGVNRTMGAAVNHARQNHTWQNRTGVLTGGIDIVKYAAEDEKGVSGTWGVHDVEYALIHELGGTIEPKNAKFLAIPVSEAARAAGSPRMMANLAYVQSIKGQPMLVDSSTGTVHYLLRKRVTIPAQPYLRPAADAKYPDLAGNIRKEWNKLRPSSTGGDDDV